MSISREIGQRLKSVRGLRSQGDVAKLWGLHKNTIGSYERGDRVPDVVVARKLCEIEAVSPSWLLTGEGSMKGEMEEASDAKVDVAFLSEIIAGVEIALNRQDLELDPDKKGELVGLLYEHFQTTKNIEKETVGRFLRLVS